MAVLEMIKRFIAEVEEAARNGQEIRCVESADVKEYHGADGYARTVTTGLKTLTVTIQPRNVTKNES